jgi:hypothetical protein
LGLLIAVADALHGITTSRYRTAETRRFSERIIQLIATLAAAETHVLFSEP